MRLSRLKDLELSLLWHRLEPWPWNFCRPWAHIPKPHSQKKGKRERNEGEKPWGIYGIFLPFPQEQGRKGFYVFVVTERRTDHRGRCGLH